jgi:hypothetical protein
MSRGPFSIQANFANRQGFTIGGSGQIDERETIFISSFTSGNPLDVGFTIQANPTGLINGVTDRVNLFVDELRAKKAFAVHSVEGGLALLGGTGFALEVAGNPIMVSDGTGLNVISPLITQSTNTFNGLTTFPLVCPQTATVPSNPEDLINLSYFQNNNPAAAVIFYLNNSSVPSPPISTYALLSNTQDGQPQSSIATSLSGIGTTQLMQSFANTILALNAGSFIPAGIWELNIFASANNSGSTTHMNLYFQLFGRTSLGVETQIGTNSALASVDATTIEQLKLSLALPFTDITPYEALVVKVYAICNRNNLTSITTYYEGTTTYSHMDTSFAVYVPPSILSLNNVWTGVNQFNQSIVGDITGNSATTTSAPDSALSANVVLKDASNVLTNTNTFTDTITLDNGNPLLYSTLNPTELKVINDTGGGGYTSIVGNNIAVFNTVSGANCQLNESGLLNTGGHDITIGSSHQINLNSTDNVNINTSVNFILGAADNIIMTATNDSVSISADDNISLVSTGNGNINLNAPNIDSYSYAMPICFDFVELDRNYSYGGGQNWKIIFTQNLNLPTHFFLDSPQVGYTSTKWRIDFTINTWNNGGGDNSVDKALAYYIDFTDQNGNGYMPGIINKNTPFCIRNSNDSTWTGGGSLSQFKPFSWTDYVDFAALSGTGSGNLPLKFEIHFAADDPKDFNFNYKLGLTRANITLP